MKYDKKELDARLRAGREPHRWRNRFHLEMPVGFTGGVKGVTFFQGRYHLLCQWSLQLETGKYLGWVRFTTRDFLSWSKPKLVLWPTDSADKDGCASGSVFVKDDKVRLLYTGMSKKANARKSCQILATLLADGTVLKDKVLIEKPPAGYTDVFKDPYFFRRYDRDYILMSAQEGPINDARACALIYREEKDGFFLLGELKTQLGFFGRAWECPSLLQLDGYDVLLFSPCDIYHRGAFERNIRSGYVVGHFSIASQELLHGAFRDFDRGFDFFAPQTCTHEGRTLLFARLGIAHREKDYPTRSEGFLYTLALPRTLRLRQGRLYEEPIDELKALRIEESRAELEESEVHTWQTPLAEGAEVLLYIIFGRAQCLNFEIRYNFEKVSIRYDRQGAVLEISREAMKLGARGTRRFTLYTEGTLMLHFFIDKTAIEIFFQHGEEAASFLVFPTQDTCPSLALFADAPIKKIMGTRWALDALH